MCQYMISTVCEKALKFFNVDIDLSCSHFNH